MAKHWGYSETSSSGKTAIAALLQFGLLTAEGALDSRTVRLTPRGLDIVVGEPSSDLRLASLQEAARSPKLYADILAKWMPHEMPVDSMLRYYLIRERNFNEASVDGFIKDFRSSLAFAKLNVPPTMDTGSALNDQPETDYDDMSTEVAMPPSHSGTSIDASAQMRRQAAPVQTPLVPAAGFLDESYPLDGGRAFILRRPESLSREELEEFDAWVTLLQRKMKRLLQQ